MRVVVAGATGALGHALVPRLRRAGHQVVALSRRPESRTSVEALGASHETVDLFDAVSLHGIFERVRPDVVVHAAKAIPKGGPVYFRDMNQTNRLHEEGTRNLLAAAVASEASRIVVESIVFAYGYGEFGDEVLDEGRTAPPKLPHPKLAAEVDGVLSMEGQVLAAAESGSIEAAALRCGLFYGPRAGTQEIVDRLRRRMLPLPGGGSAFWPMAYIDDVADAFLKACESTTGGVFNVVDDEPVRLRDFVEEVARHGQAPKPWSIPPAVGRVVAPYFTQVATTSMRVSNSKAEHQLGWTPAHPTYRDGLSSWARSADT